MNKVGIGFGAAALVLAATAAQAEGQEYKYYLKGEGGVIFEENVDIESGVSAGIDLDSGYAFGVGIGRYIHDGKWRLEADFGYQSQDIDSGLNVTGGEFQTYHLMGSIYRDFFTGSSLRPFIGAGVGIGLVDASFDNGLGGLSSDDSDPTFLWQGTAGVALDLSDRWTADLRYRYLDMVDYEVEGAGSGGYGTHSVLFGLRRDFGPVATAPAPEPDFTPEPSPLQTLEDIVYFDFDESDIRPDEAAELDAAARAIENREIDVIRIEGHTDTSGSAEYNDGLSQRRAEAVRDYLISRGVPGDKIVIDWKGESDPAVDTGDGVREQRNRRAELVIRFR